MDRSATGSLSLPGAVPPAASAARPAPAVAAIEKVGTPWRDGTIVRAVEVASVWKEMKGLTTKELTFRLLLASRACESGVCHRV